jgi:adenylate kinase
MNIVIFGPQGSGKGTQAKIISERLKIPHISTGDIFRSLNGKLKENVDALIDKGNLVPDELTIEILNERISKQDCLNGYVLDGFPRNLNQAKAFENIAKIDVVLELYISDEESIKRISGRLFCPKCKAGFNSQTSPKPKKENICDFCNTVFEKRKDDTLEFVKKRLETYHRETQPVLDHYKHISNKIDGIGTIEEVSKRIEEII